ncbi:MAG: hypothetical protein JJE13_06845 [Thermoleophilia bacterium]|nr:hypothetical protein [Thermoleophilia bacterium]
MCPQHKSENGSDPGLPPGAERFWGQFSEARGGRSSADDEPQAAPRDKDEQAESKHECLEWCPICRSAELLKATASPEIMQQIHSIQNEAITILKAFAATYAERTGEDPFARGKAETNGDSPHPEPDEPKVTDISIE